jgi:hypothetical protein
MKKSYIVTFRVDGRYKALIETEETDLETIKSLAEDEYYEADFGELQDIDGYARMVEDYDTGEIIWDRE